MNLVSLGRTHLVVPQLAFGALPIQRAGVQDAIRLLRTAFAAGVRFFDTARAYSDSEEKIGNALAEVRPQIIIATKTAATDAAGARRDLETSLAKLRTDYIDIIQLHNPEKIPQPADEGSAYAALSAARRQGRVRFIGITNHRAAVAREAVASGLFDTLQFPLSHISSPEDLSLVEHCRQHDVGFIAMKALCGGLLTNVFAAFAFFRQLPGARGRLAGVGATGILMQELLIGGDGVGGLRALPVIGFATAAPQRQGGQNSAGAQNRQPPTG